MKNLEYPMFESVEAKFNAIMDEVCTENFNPANVERELIDLGHECNEGETFVPFLALLFSQELDIEDYIIEDLAADWDPFIFAWNCVQAGRLIEQIS